MHLSQANQPIYNPHPNHLLCGSLLLWATTTCPHHPGIQQLETAPLTKSPLKSFPVGKLKPVYPALLLLFHSNHTSGSCPHLLPFALPPTSPAASPCGLHGVLCLFWGICEYKPLLSWQSFHVCVSHHIWLKTNLGYPESSLVPGCRTSGKHRYRHPAAMAR